MQRLPIGSARRAVSRFVTRSATRSAAGAVATLALAAAAALAASSPARATERTVGVMLYEPASYAGYTIFSSMVSRKTCLIDNQGLLVHSWQSAFRPGLSYYILENGDLLRAGDPGGVFGAGGAAGNFEVFTWDGVRTWVYTYSTSDVRAHHDVEMLPNGNVLMIAWERRSAAEAVAAGRDPNSMSQNQLWPDHIIEVARTGPESGAIVWEWHAWDHLIQDFDPTKDNYGVVGDHPELIDINYRRSSRADWLHVNAIDYHAGYDQILINTPQFNEFWIIDHSTTTAEARGHTGGNSGRGGDLLYRWGNPAAYRAGGSADKQLFGQHDAQWIPDGSPGAGNVIVFNNGVDRPEGRYSSVVEIAPPVDEKGAYAYTSGEPYAPAAPEWEYEADFYASFISGAQRLPNGNTLICEGPNGTFHEVTPAGETVWLYVNPVVVGGPLTQGQHPGNANQTFRAPRYALDYAGFDGRDLTPVGKVELYACPADTNLDDVVDFQDLLAVLSAWGPCVGTCWADVTHDGDVGFEDLLAVLAAFGLCE